MGHNLLYAISKCRRGCDEMQARTSVGSKTGLLDTIAKVISKVTNPFGLSVLLFLLVAWAESNSLPALVSWIAIILLFLVVLPLAYVHIRTSANRGKSRWIKDPITFFRQRQRDICIVGVASVLPCIILLIFLKAPSLLIASFVLMLAISLGVALVHKLYKASHHLAVVTGLVVIVVALTWEHPIFPVLAAIPVVGWARYSLRQHSPGQLAAGFGLAVVIGVPILYSFGLLRNLVM